MQKINDLFGKRVISQSSGDQIATVRDVVLDADVRRIVALVIGNSRSDEQVVSWPQILGAGEFIIIDGLRDLPAAGEDPEIIELRRNAEQITGKKVISASGQQLGTIGDMYVGRDGAIIGFELKHGLLSGSDPKAIRATDVQAVGRDAVIASTSEPIRLAELTDEELDLAERHAGGSSEPAAVEREGDEPARVDTVAPLK